MPAAWLVAVMPACMQDNYTLNDGSCSCHKRGGIRNACASGWCMDSVGELAAAAVTHAFTQQGLSRKLSAGPALPAPGEGLVAAINTPGLQNTNKCAWQLSRTSRPV